jgi:hypothetical protein
MINSDCRCPGCGQCDASLKVERLSAELAEAKADAERFAWYFGTEDKVSFMKTYIDGIANGFNLDQWRATIDVAIRGTIKKVGRPQL